jgi:Cu-processing system permease protein
VSAIEAAERVQGQGVVRELWPGHGILVMAGFTLREALRKRILLGAVLITALFVAIYAGGAYYGFNSIDHSTRITDLTRPIFRSFLMLSGLQATTFVASLLAIFISVGTISSEVDGHLLDAVLPKPIRRCELVLGKWIGFALMVAIYIAATAGAIVLLTRLLGGFWASDVGAGIGTLVLSGIFLMSLALLGSSYLSTVTNGVIVTVLYSSAFIAGLMEQVAIFLQNNVMERLGILVSLLVPSDALWRFAAQNMAASHTAAFGGPGLFTSNMPPTAWVVLWAACETAVAVALACWAFSARDL